MTLIIATRRLPDASVAIQPDGAITSANAFKLRDRVTAVLAATRPGTIFVDLRAVPTIDDAGVDALRSGHTAAAACGAALVVVEPRPSVCEHLRTRGLTAVLPGDATDEAQHQVNAGT